ncbi:MAG: methyltransferase [Gilvibacter sp.]
MSAPFKFKQFEVAQDRCAMKIGTDAVLLGAWVSLDANPDSILDIGAGTGVIALQLAQRAMAELIDAVEIDADAYEQCTHNFESSPWADRLFCYHAAIQEFASEIDEKYDLIVSNPPFYSDEYKSGDAKRDVARFNDALPFDHLVVCATHLLSENGIFALIIPSKEELQFLESASKAGLFVQRRCGVFGNKDSKEKRVLLQLCKTKQSPKLETLIIETTRHEYTPEYVSLVKDFYLKL